jgi:SAM-dependent methyltransferase
MVELYDTIGEGYRRLRRPDARIAAAIAGALGPAATIVNVGAGTGSYEPTGRHVVAIEPSIIMVRQRPPGAAPVIRAYGSALPFRDRSFDAASAILTIHHWSDQEAGLRELRRVARQRVVIFTYDSDHARFWLTDYFPEIYELGRRIGPSLDTIRRALPGASVVDVPIPHDCADGFLGAYWRRPRAYLRPDVRSAISGFSMIVDVAPGLARLEADLASGEWERQYGHLLHADSLDLGYRLVVA